MVLQWATCHHGVDLNLISRLTGFHERSLRVSHRAEQKRAARSRRHAHQAKDHWLPSAEAIFEGSRGRHYDTEEL